jgi:DNA repair protein RecN (Recombination protein N)
MLESLRIKNIAVIDEAEIPFKAGLNVLSGETGAGKSIVLEAISLILGSRASTDLIRAECEEASVEALFDISKLDWLRDRMKQTGIVLDSTELLVKRTVNRSGRHRIHINGELATLSMLQSLCDGLVDLCGQNEHQSLVKPHTQLELLDRYGGLTGQRQKFEELHQHYKSIEREADHLRESEKESRQRADFIAFQLQELRDAALTRGEDEALASEKLLLQSAEARLQIAETARSGLEDEDGALPILRGLVQKLRSGSAMDSALDPVREALERAVAEAEDAAHSLSRYVGQIELDPTRLDYVQERLALLANLRRKYGTSIDEMLETLAGLERDSQLLTSFEDRLTEAQARLELARAEMEELGKRLSKLRIKASELFSKTVTDELVDLRMPGASFSIELTQRERVEEWTFSGADQIQFLVQTNTGEGFKPIGKVASGGELSRLMLAIRRVIADHGGIGVYLFDEIDAGIGGQTAFQVGKKLRSVARYNQVICITHLPQVASFAHHHLSVRKATQGKRTVTEVVELNESERKKELARMLGGPELTKKSLENAAELLQLAQR